MYKITPLVRVINTTSEYSWKPFSRKLGLDIMDSSGTLPPVVLRAQPPRPPPTVQLMIEKHFPPARWPHWNIAKCQTIIITVLRNRWEFGDVKNWPFILQRSTKEPTLLLGSPREVWVKVRFTSQLQPSNPLSVLLYSKYQT